MPTKAQFAAIFYFKITLQIGPCFRVKLPGPACWLVWIEGKWEDIYRAHGAHKIHVLPMWDWEGDSLEENIAF